MLKKLSIFTIFIFTILFYSKIYTMNQQIQKINNENADKAFQYLYSYLSRQTDTIFKGLAKDMLASLPKKTFNTHHKNNTKYLSHLIAQVIPTYMASKKIITKIEPNLVNQNNLTPAHLILKTLIFEKSHKRRKKLSKALKLLLKNGANPCIMGKLDTEEYSLWTMSTHYEKAFNLLLKYADLFNSDPTTGDTAIHQIMEYTLKNQYSKLLLKKLLKKAKITTYKLAINIKNKSGLTPLHKAVQEKDKTIIALLLDHKANPRQKNKLNQTPEDMLESLYRNNKIKTSRYREIKKLFPL